MIFLTPEQIVFIQKKVEDSQNGFMNESSLYAITAKYLQGYYDNLKVYEVAMNYFEDLINKHIFQNGNKRTAIVASIFFLEMNGYRVSANNNILYELIMSYFENKNTLPLQKYLMENMDTRNYYNPSIDSFNYHMYIFDTYASLIQKLSLT